MLSVTAAAETATKTRMRKAEASEPRMEEARVTKAETSEADKLAFDMHLQRAAVFLEFERGCRARSGHDRLFRRWFALGAVARLAAERR